MSDLKLVRLSSGEEIVGVVTRTDETTTIVDGYNLISTKEGRIGFIPFMQYTKAAEGVEIPNQFVMFVIEPAEQLAEQIKSMKSDIVTPSKKIVTN
jgi:hypothetical protein